MKNYIVSLSKRVLLLSGALAIFAACDDGDLGDIYKGNSSGEYVSDVNWTDAADKKYRNIYQNISMRMPVDGIPFAEASIGKNRIHRKPENQQVQAVAVVGHRDMHWMLSPMLISAMRTIPNIRLICMKTS